MGGANFWITYPFRHIFLKTRQIRVVFGRLVANIVSFGYIKGVTRGLRWFGLHPMGNLIHIEF
jgi:hypothetical protein